MTYDPKNGWLYVAEFSGDVRAYDRVGNPMLAFPTSPSAATDSVAFDSNNRWLYVIGYNGSGAAYDEQGNLQTTAGGFPGLHQARQIAFHPETQQLYVADNDASNVVVYDETGTPVTPSGGFPNLPPLDTTGISYDPVHAWLWVTDGHSLAAYDGDGNSTVPTSQPLAHADGAFNLTFDQYNGLLYLANRGGKTVTAYDQQGNEYVLPNPMVGFADPLSVAVVK
jgi:DNA-binding beta-propeller fold protein YncE